MSLSQAIHVWTFVAIHLLDLQFRRVVSEPCYIGASIKPFLLEIVSSRWGSMTLSLEILQIAIWCWLSTLHLFSAHLAFSSLPVFLTFKELFACATEVFEGRKSNFLPAESIVCDLQVTKPLEDARSERVGSAASSNKLSTPQKTPRSNLTPTASPMRKPNPCHGDSSPQLSSDEAQLPLASVNVYQQKPSSSRIFSHTASPHDPEVWAPPPTSTRLHSNLSEDGSRGWSNREPKSGFASCFLDWSGFTDVIIDSKIPSLTGLPFHGRNLSKHRAEPMSHEPA